MAKIKGGPTSGKSFKFGHHMGHLIAKLETFIVVTWSKVDLTLFWNFLTALVLPLIFTPQHLFRPCQTSDIVFVSIVGFQQISLTLLPHK